MIIKLTTIIFLVCISTTSLTEERHTSFWHALEPFGNEKEFQSEKIQQAFFEFGSFFQTMDAWRASFYLPHKQQPNWFAFREDIQDYLISEFIALKRPYKSNPQGLASSSILFEGFWSNTGTNKAPDFDFLIHQPNSDKQNRLTDKKRFGEISGEVSFSEGSLNKDNTRIDLNANMSFESMMFTEMLDSIETINKLFEQKQLDDVSTEIRINNIAQKTAQNLEHLSPFEQKIFATLYTSFPNIMTTLARFSVFEKLAKPVISPSGMQATMFTFQLQLDLDKFSESFPDTLDDFEDLLTSLSTHTEIFTHDNKKIAQFAYDASTQKISANLVIANGGFMLRNNNGELLDEIIIPSQLDALEYQFITDANVSLFGLDIDVSNVEVQGHYQSGLGKVNSRQPRLNRTATIDVQMATVPKIDVQGALLYFIPYWLIDLLIPGTLETLIVDAFVDVVTGNDGEGFTLGFQFKEIDNQHHVEMNTAIEMPHELLQAILKVEDPEESSQARLYKTLRYNLREDFATTAAAYEVPSLDEYLEQYLD